MRNLRLRSKFLVLLIALFAVSVVANYFWTTQNLEEQTEKELAEKGRVLAQQMDAVWTFMSANQDQLETIAFTDEGSYRGLHCAIAGRSIGMIFSMETNYTTRFVNFNPRNPNDNPDTFETAALTTFLADHTVKDYYEISDFEGGQYFRYSAPMNIQENCLECHGEPQGETDVTGFAKEGWKIGDVGGAISIAIPLDIYLENERATIVTNLIFFAALLFMLVIIIWIALSKLVIGPLSKIKSGVNQIQTGDMEVRLNEAESSKEMDALVTDFNQMANNLSEYHNNLETEVRDRTAQLARANDILRDQRTQMEAINARLRDENEYKSDFLAMMSHELRTPLTSVIAFAELLGNNKYIQASAETTEVCAEILANSQALLSMINNILEMSRVDAGKATLNLDMADVGDICEATKQVIQPLAEQKDIDFTVEINSSVPLVWLDSDKIHHVLQNLLGNSIKFTSEGGRVRLLVDHVAANDQLIIKVEDSGIGIDKQHQLEIFERFRQLDSSATRHYDGTGLGLALAKEYTEMHGGTIQVESELGKGSVFTVAIPANPSPEEFSSAERQAQTEQEQS